jgi:hypothetical protein
MWHSLGCFHAEAFTFVKQPMLLKSTFTGSSTFLAMDRFRMMPDEVSGCGCNPSSSLDRKNILTTHLFNTCCCLRFNMPLPLYRCAAESRAKTGSQAPTRSTVAHCRRQVGSIGCRVTSVERSYPLARDRSQRRGSQCTRGAALVSGQ